jgi:hypothetical protein
MANVGSIGKGTLKMNKIACGNCNFLNEANMNFCTSCGKLIGTVAQSSVPTVAKVAILQQKTEVYPIVNKSSSSKLWIGGLLGCFGILVLLSAAIAFLATYSLSGITDSISNTSRNYNVTPSNSNQKPIISETSEGKKKEFEKDLLDVLKDRKEAGKFKQMTANVVNKDDFFPIAKAAVQSSFHNGSRYVALSIGKFDNFEDAKKNFDQQFSNVKKKGGKTQILETAIDGTINGVHQLKDTFTAEYCTKSAFCYRMASTDPKALKDFIENFIKL